MFLVALFTHLTSSGIKLPNCNTKNRQKYYNRIDKRCLLSMEEERSLKRLLTGESLATDNIGR